MKVKIGKYKSYFGPYQLAETLCFWAGKQSDEYGFPHTPDWVHTFGEWLAHGSIKPDPKPGDKLSVFDRDERPTTLLYRLLLWIDSKKKRTVKIRIDRWDTWSMDHTLALITLPMLRQLRDTKHGAPYVDPRDVPEHLRPKKQTKKERETGHTDSTHFERWDWVLDEMIFAFEHIVDDTWEEQFHTGEYDLRSQVAEWTEDGKPKLYEMVEGPGHTAETDYDGIRAVYQRIDRGLVLFGKYYRSLWD